MVTHAHSPPLLRHVRPQTPHAPSAAGTTTGLSLHVIDTLIVTYTVVGYHGGARLTYEDALAAIFIEGIIFLILALSGLRAKIFSLVPQQLMFALAGGIGMFLAFIGLQTAEGIGLIAYQPATLVTLGGCPMKDRAYMYILKDGGFDPSIGPTFTNVGNGGPICKTDASGVLQGMDPYPASPNYACLGESSQRVRATLYLMTPALQSKRHSVLLLLGMSLTFVNSPPPTPPLPSQARSEPF